MFGIFSRQIDQIAADHIGMRNVVKNYIRIGGSGFNRYIAVVKKGGKHAVNIRRDILDAKQIQLGNSAGKKVVLDDVQNSVVGDNPNIQIVLRKGGIKK